MNHHRYFYETNYIILINESDRFITGNLLPIQGIELNAAGQTHAIHFDMEIEQYHPELLDNPYLAPEDPFCHQCKRRHNQNFCVRNGRSKRFQMNKTRYK